MESSSATLRLPRRVRAAALAAIGGTQVLGELAWMSWAGTVWRLAGRDGAVYVKRAASLAGERDRLEWLQGRLPVPEVVGFFQAAGDDWLMTREVPGVPLYHRSVGWTPSRVARLLGGILRTIHATDATDCPTDRRVQRSPPQCNWKAPTPFSPQMTKVSSPIVSTLASTGVSFSAFS